MSDYIINDEWIHDFMVNIEELIDESIEYEGYKNPVPPLREIVRCKDCTSYIEGLITDDNEREPSYCWQWNREYIPEDGFCSWGERREQ